MVRAHGPGRVNLIGEHTDYNDGLCLPFAIARGVTVSAERIDGDEMFAQASDLGEEDSFAFADPPRAEGWRAFVRGTVAELRAAGHDVPAARLEIEGDLPRGAGLSSSAALESALCLALLALAGEEPDRLELVRLGARVENEWVGAQTGLLDHLAVHFGHEGSALRIDIAALELEEVPLELGDWTLAVLDSNSPHDNAASGYNQRREECAQAAELLGIESLRRATLEDVPRLPDPLDRRVRHVIEENERVDRAVSALAHEDLREVGALLDSSHASLRDLYEVSTPELERTVKTMKDAGAAGARVMGGGFGGSVLALFPPGADLPPGSLGVVPGPAARLV